MRLVHPKLIADLEQEVDNIKWCFISISLCQLHLIVFFNHYPELLNAEMNINLIFRNKSIIELQGWCVHMAEFGIGESAKQLPVYINRH